MLVGWESKACVKGFLVGSSPYLDTDEMSVKV